MTCEMFTNPTRHRANTAMYSLTFCVRVLLPERHQWKPAVQTAAAMLRTPPSTASHRSAARADPADRSHYVVISRDGRKLVTRVCVMLPEQRKLTREPIANPPNSAQLGSSLYHAPKLHPGLCSSAGVRPRTDRHTDTRA